MEADLGVREKMGIQISLGSKFEASFSKFQVPKLLSFSLRCWLCVCSLSVLLFSLVDSLVSFSRCELVCPIGVQGAGRLVLFPLDSVAVLLASLNL